MKTNFKIINTEEEYQKVVKRTLLIFHADEGTLEAKELSVLLLLLRDYEDKLQ